MSEPEAEEPDSLKPYWDTLKPGIDVARMSEDELRAFVLGVIDGSIFTSDQVRDDSLLGIVFMPLALGVFAAYNPESLKTIGVICEDYNRALPRSINGYPIFASFRMVHVDDWARARKAIVDEQERRKSIHV